jgi:small GTP-binding protein
MGESNNDLDVERTLITLTILGESTVGKSQLSSVFTGQAFQQNDLATVGYDIKTTNYTLLNGKKIKIKIWDTAGQERFKNMASQYIKSCNGILFVYDITNRESFEKIDSWIKFVKTKVDLNTIPFLIVGNKVDLENRVVSKEEGEKYVNYLSVPFYETSAKDNINVTESFSELINKIYELNKTEFENKAKSNNQNFHLNEDKGKNNDNCCNGEKKKKKKNK